MSRLMVLLALAALIAMAQADIYLHSPRGQNDRCDEKSNNRNNENRCYDTQNNAAGGYSTCESEMVFYTDTSVRIEWYTQHNCGNGAQLKNDPHNPEGVHCNYVVQLGCNWTFALFTDTAENYQFTDGKSLGRPGSDQYNVAANDADQFNTFGDTCTETRPLSSTCANGNNDAGAACLTNLAQGTGTFNSQSCSCSARKMQTYCYHEPEGWYLKCLTRQRNKGLFTADQNVRTDSGAVATRQNNGATRYGFECNEERDYWPYWHPTPWIDLVVFTSDTSQCGFYAANTQNQNDKCECVAPDGSTPTQQSAAMVYNQELPCTSANFNWKCWGNWNFASPPCILAPSQPDNALGRVDTRGDNSEQVDGSELVHYDWNVPSSLIPSGYTATRCLIRIRYNMSNADVPATYDFSDNNYVKTDPVHTYGNGSSAASPDQAMPLRMAVDTAQYGRTFEDRTYIFTISQRPSNLVGKVIYNVNVHGKRGNIAQVRNCYEYDFVPLILYANLGDLIHFQWCLSDYNDNGNAGEGRAGTDRANVAPLPTYDDNIFGSLNNTFTIFSSTDLAQLAWLGQLPKYCNSTSYMLGANNDADNPYSCHFLNGVRDANGKPTAYFSYIATVVSTGSFQYMSTRNNNFSNRSQKATINVGISPLSNGAIAGAVIGSVAGAAALGAGGYFLVKKKGLPSFKSRV